jgi:hypothetical protein
LNPDFLPLYDGVLAPAEEKWVYYSPQAVAHKKLPALSSEDVRSAFGEGVRVFNDQKELEEALRNTGENNAVVMMSSGNFSGLNFDELFASY